MPVTSAVKVWNNVLRLKLTTQSNGTRKCLGILDTSFNLGAGVSGGGDSMVCEGATGVIAFARTLGLLDFFDLTSVLN